MARVLAAASLAGLGEFLKLLFLLDWLWSYLTPPVLTTYETSVKYLNYMERTVLDAIHAAIDSIEYVCLIYAQFDNFCSGNRRGQPLELSIHIDNQHIEVY